MAELGEARVRLTLLDEFTKPLQAAQGALMQMARAAAPALVGLASIGGAIKVLKDSVNEAANAEKIFTQVTTAIKSTGGAAGFTAKELAVMAKEMQTLTGINDEAVLSAESVLLTFRSIKGDMFKDAIKAAADLSARLGTDLTSAARTVGRALENPTNGLRQLKMAGVELSQSQRDLIKELIDAGRKAEAQAIIMQELTEAFGGASVAARNTFSGALVAAKSAVSDLMEELGKQLLPLLRQAVEWVEKNSKKYTEMAGKIGQFLVKNFDLLIATVRILIGLQIITWAQKASEAMMSLAASATASAAGVKRVTAAVTTHSAALSFNERIAMSVTKAGRDQVAVMDATAKASGGMSGALGALTRNFGAILTILLLVNEAILLWSRNMQKQIDGMVADTNRLGRAFDALRLAQRQIAWMGKAVLDEAAFADLEAHAKELEEKVERTKKSIETLRANQGKVVGHGESETMIDNSAAIKERQRELDKLIADAKIYRDVLNQTSVIEPPKPPEEPPYNAVTEAIKELEKSLKKQKESLDFYNKVLAETGNNFAEAEAAMQAYNTVQATGIKMDSKRADSLREKVRAINDEREAIERLKKFEALKLELAASGDKYLMVNREHKQVIRDIINSTETLTEKVKLLRLEQERHEKQIHSMAVVMDAHVQANEEATEIARQAAADMDATIAAQDRYIAVIGESTEALREFQIEEALLAEKLKNPKVDEDAFRIKMRIILEQEDLMRMKEELLGINKAFVDDLTSGLKSAFQSGLVEFMEGGDDALKNFGENLKKVLINAVAKWLTDMIAAQIKIAAMNATMGGGQAAAGGAGAGGGGMSMWAGLAKMFGGGGGAGGGGMAGISAGTLMGIGAIAAVAAVAAWSKHEQGKIENKKWGTMADVQFEGGAVVSDWAGKLNQTGKRVADALKNFFGGMQQVTGTAIEGVERLAIRIRNDKSGFEASLDGVLIGVFKTAEEAIVAAAKQIFTSDAMRGELDPIVAQVIENFDVSKGADAMLEAVANVQGVIDSLSGLSDIELTLRNLAGAASQMQAELEELGVSMGDAQVLAGRWTAQTLQDLRDQITGREKTHAELMAQKEREAALFNAKKALMVAELNIEKEKLQRQIQMAQVGGRLAQAELELGAAALDGQQIQLQEQGHITQAYADLFQSDLMIEQTHFGIRADLVSANADLLRQDLRVRQGYAGASLELLEIQMAALDQVIAAIANIPDIDIGDINIPGGGGHGGGGGGQSTAEQIASTIDSLGLPLENLRDQFKEEAEAIKYLTKKLNEGKISTERFAQVMAELQAQGEMTITSMAVGILQSMGKTEEAAILQHKMAKMEFDLKVIEFQMTIAHFLAIGKISEETAAEMMAILAEAQNFEWPEFEPDEQKEQEMQAIIDSLGLPLEALRDQFKAQRASIMDLAKGVRDGTLAVEDFDRAMDELGDEATKSVLGMAADILDKMGKSKQAAKMRYDIEKLEWKMKLAEFNLTIKHFLAIGAITREFYAEMMGILDAAQEWEFPEFEWTPPRDDHDDDEPAENPLLQALLAAIEDLRQMAEGYRDFLKSLERGPLSGKTMQKRFSETLTEFEDTLARAQAGDIAAMHELLELGPELLNLAAEYLDPSSTAYQALLQMVTGSMDALADQMEAIVEAAPNDGVEDRLDTIIEIQQAWARVWGGGFPGWANVAAANTGPIISALQTTSGNIVHAIGLLKQAVVNTFPTPAPGGGRIGDQDDPLGPSGGYNPGAMNSVIGSVAGINTDPATAIIVSNVALKDELRSINVALKNGFGQVVTSTDYQTETMEQLSFSRPRSFEGAREAGPQPAKWRG